MPAEVTVLLLAKEKNSFFTATQVHNGHRFLPVGTCVEVLPDGTIVAIHPTGKVKEIVQHFDGIITPGFVNAHCHLELSHMKGAIPEHTGLIPFLQQVGFRRNDFSEEQKVAARHEAFSQMKANGVVAVGDIGNGNDTLDLRAKDEMHFHTFVECIGFPEEIAATRFENSSVVLANFKAQTANKKLLRQSIVPHTPYTVSKTLFERIDAAAPNELISIHNQEAAAEDEFYLHKTGAVRDLLSSFRIDATTFQPSGKSSLQTYSTWLSASHSMIFVHNTFTSKEDIRFAKSRFQTAFWCLCPNANLYIENTLPDVKMLAENTGNICLGTDSLSSNHQLSILSEIETLQSHFPELSIEKLISWATINGAKALQMDEIIGSIEPGKKPGLNLIRSLNT